MSVPNRADTSNTSATHTSLDKIVGIHPICDVVHEHSHSCLVHCLKGTVLGFLMAAVPWSIKQRKFSPGYAIGFAALIGIFRANSCSLFKIRELIAAQKPSISSLQFFLTPRLNVFVSAVRSLSFLDYSCVIFERELPTQIQENKTLPNTTWQIYSTYLSIIISIFLLCSAVCGISCCSESGTRIQE